VSTPRETIIRDRNATSGKKTILPTFHGFMRSGLLPKSQGSMRRLCNIGIFPIETSTSLSFAAAILAARSQHNNQDIYSPAVESFDYQNRYPLFILSSCHPSKGVYKRHWPLWRISTPNLIAPAILVGASGCM